MSYFSTIKVGLYVLGDSGTFGINNATLAHGKFTTATGHDHEEQISTVNGKTFEAGRHNWVDACNRDMAFVGTEGSFEIWRSGHKVVHLGWAIPWSGSTGPDGSWTTDKPRINVEKFMSGHYEVEAEGFDVNESSRTDQDTGATEWPTEWQGSIKIKIL